MTDEWQQAEQAAGSARETLDQIETILKTSVQGEGRSGEVLLALAFGLGTFAFQTLSVLHGNNAAATAEQLHYFVDRLQAYYTTRGQTTS